MPTTPGEFTLTGGLWQLLRDSADAGSAEDLVALKGASGTLTSNIPEDKALAITGGAVYVTPRTFVVLSDGQISQDGSTPGVTLLADDPALNFDPEHPLQWTLHLRPVKLGSKQVVPVPWTFNAPAPGTTLSLDQITPALALGAAQYIQGPPGPPGPPGSGTGTGGGDLVDDTTPQLGGNLDLNGHLVGTASAADLTKLHGTGTLTGNNTGDQDLSGKYTKPGTGIPATDLASAVQTSLGKADSAVQSLTGYATTAAVAAAYQPLAANLTSFASKTPPSGGIVGTTDTQTLGGKTIDLAANTVTTTLAQLNTAVTDADLPPVASPTFTGTVTAPVLKATTGAGAGKYLTSASDGTGSWEAQAGLNTVGVGRAVFIAHGGTVPGGTPEYTIVIELEA